MYTRRRAVGLVAGGLIGSTSGCLDVVRGDSPLEFRAERALAGDDALAETGYEEVAVEPQDLEETIDVGVEREVNARFWTASYAKTVEVGGQRRTAATVAVISLPAAEPLGSSVDPFDDLDTGELLESFADQLAADYDELRDVRFEGTVDLAILGERREVDRFRAEIVVEDETVEVVLTVAAVAHESDLIVLVGGHPEAVPEEAADVETVMESVEHPA